MMVLWERIDAADEAEPRDKALEPLREELRELIERRPNDPDLLYALGYVGYCHPATQHDPERVAEVVSALKKTIALEPRYALAQLYLGHLAFDRRDFPSAAHWLRSAKEPGSLDAFQDLKASELLLCCQMFTSGLGASVMALDSFARESMAAAAIDAFPMQLVKTVEYLMPCHPSPAAAIQVGERVLSLLADLERVGVFQEQVKAITRFLALQKDATEQG
ncbi:MAG: hypothetical protein R3B72_07430 [Polyangiaceae bacterium]